MEAKPEVDAALHIGETKDKYQLKSRVSSFLRGKRKKKRKFWLNFLWENGIKRYHFRMFNFTWNRRIGTCSGYAEVSGTKS